ncbi:MAG: hypothetical protein QXG63_04805 [Nitrososphaerales archaeon]
MPISKTPTHTPFPAFEVEQESSPTRYLPLPTPESLKRTVLFGLPLRSFLTGEEVPDETIQQFIDQAISEIEHTLDLYITPVTFQERHDYSRHQFFWSFGYLKVNHGPILDVSKFQLTFNNGNGMVGSPPLVDIPLEFIHVQPPEQTIQLVPAQGVTISGLIMSIYSGLGFHAFNNQALSHWPGAVLVEYRAGFKEGEVPALLVSLIENLAAWKMLSVMGPILFPHNSVSIGIDGTSQSVGTLGPAFLQNRLADLRALIDQQMDAAKGYYQKRFLIDYL